MYGSEGYAKCTVAWLLSSVRILPRYHLPFGAKNLDWLQVSGESQVRVRAANCSLKHRADLHRRCKAGAALSGWPDLVLITGSYSANANCVSCSPASSSS